MESWEEILLKLMEGSPEVFGGTMEQDVSKTVRDELLEQKATKLAFSILEFIQNDPTSPVYTCQALKICQVLAPMMRPMKRKPPLPKEECA